MATKENYPKSPYNLFRGVGPQFSRDIIATGKLTKTFDEPTYLTFKLKFDSDNLSTNNTNFDKMPQPLFSTYAEDNVNVRNFYSTYQFLRDANEFVRADMLLDFVEKWIDLQELYQWYFTSIEGLDNVLKIDPKRGIRVPQEGRITINMLEALDWRISHLLNVYRKIAWDDVYQRWILPDMMRYFKLYIYVTEFRTFHQSNYGSRLFPGSDTPPLILKMIEGVTPVYILELERCEFDITSFSTTPTLLTINEVEMRELSFDIKVGTFKEKYVNPILNFFYSDDLINGLERTVETEIPAINLNNQPNVSPALGDYAQGNALTDTEHESAKPFIQTGYVDNIRNASPNYSINTNMVNPIEPNTWLGNTVNFGVSFLKNEVETQIDKAKTMKIPGLGISFTEAMAALQSKNIFTVFGMIRKALTENIQNTVPSALLEQKIIDGAFRSYVESVAKSEATDEDEIEIIAAANRILSEKGRWEEVKDFSYSTDLVSKALNEINVSPKGINSKDAQKKTIFEQTRGDRSLATDLDGKALLQKTGKFFEGTPSSATSKKRLAGNKFNIPAPSQATINKIEKT